MQAHPESQAPTAKRIQPPSNSEGLTLERAINGRRIAAKLVKQHGNDFLPILERTHQLVQELEGQDALLARLDDFINEG